MAVPHLVQSFGIGSILSLLLPYIGRCRCLLDHYMQTVITYLLMRVRPPLYPRLSNSESARATASSSFIRLPSENKLEKIFSVKASRIRVTDLSYSKRSAGSIKRLLAVSCPSAAPRSFAAPCGFFTAQYAPAMPSKQ